MIARKIAVSVLACFVFTTIAFSQAKKDRPRLHIPKFEDAPTIDGVMKEGEWARSAAVTGFIGATGSFGKVMVPKESHIYLGHDDKNIYIAVWTQLAPGEKPSRKYRRRDSKVYMDRQQFEIWLTPPTGGHTAAYQMIGNAYGALYDIKLVPALGIKNPGWNPDVKFKNSYKQGEYWTAEVAIPIEELADPDHYQPDKPWGGMVAVAWPQRSWPFTYGWYKNIETHAQMTLSDATTCVRLLDLSSLFENRFEPQLELVNGEDKAGEFTINASRKDMQVEKTVTVAAGKTKKITLTGNLPPATEKVNTIKLSVTGPTGNTLIEGNWMYRPMSVKERTVKKVKPKPWKMTTRLSYAPLNMGAKCWVDLLEAPMRDRIETVTFEVLNEQGKSVAVNTAYKKGVKTIVDRQFECDAAETYFWLPAELPHGKYTVKTSFLDKNGRVLVSTTDSFRHKDYSDEFIWLNSEKYGEKLTAEPPYTPLKTSENGFKIWGRQYEMRGALPARMQSQKKQLLARPVNFVAVVDGKRYEAKIAKGFNIEEANANKATFSGKYEVAGITLNIEGRILFDGGLIYELNAEPKAEAKAIERLYLSVPVRREVADYMWTTRGGTNGMNFLLENLPQKGVIWDSDSVADFVPYIGLADDDRAIQWFADNDHEWIRGEQTPCAQIVRHDDEVEIQVNLVRRQCKGKSFQARFGLIATPIKPLPKDWRNAILHYGNFTNSNVAFFYGPGHGKVGPVHWHDSAGLARANGIDVPKNRTAGEVLDGMDGKGYPDISAIRKNLGKEAAGTVKSGIEKYGNPKAVRQCYFHNASMYFEGTKSKAFRKFFRGDWTIMPSGGWFHLRPVDSYQDFFCFHLTQFLKFWHVNGMYFDECYFAPDYNVFNGQGKVLPDGSIRPSVGLTLERRFLYRVRQCIIDQGIDPFIWVHTSGMMAPYAIGATDIAMFGEPNIPTPQQDIMDNINEQYMLTIGRSQKFGFVPVWMTMAGRGGSQWALPGRQTFGWCWLHDTVPEVHTHVRARPTVEYRAQWGIGAEDVDFHGYWQDGGYVETTDPEYRVSFWTRPHPDNEEKKKVLMMVMNMHYPEDKNSTVQLTIDPGKIGLPDGWSVRNLESMPDFLKREKVLDRLDAESNNGYGEVEKGPMQILGRNLLFWKGQNKYKIDNLKVISDGKKTFTISVPERDFLTLLIE
ncbi:MAG: hypothetical protein KGZ25_08690 [Planctomycetes bacterium]|nr:hypothetical protein [Planctomycetota bacterium]